MKFVIQRVKEAGVSIEGSAHSSINKGLLVFFCAEKGDEELKEFGGKKLNPDEVLDYFVNKILKLRIFEDEAKESPTYGKMNLSLIDIKGEILVISQFTLAASVKKGTRPSFDNAMPPTAAKKMYEDFLSKLCAKLKEEGLNPPKAGVFGADMKVSLINDGPVTILMP